MHLGYIFDSRCYVANLNLSLFTRFIRQICIPKISDFTKNYFFPSLVGVRWSQQGVRWSQEGVLRSQEGVRWSF